ncbi:MAG: radical SAM protein [Promethearchaeota archaeon]
MQNQLFFPEIIQIEVTSFCNFNCKMCLRNFQKEEYQNISIELFKQIAKSVFPKLKKVVLYGHGEPLMHPEFEQLVRITREYLPEEGKIEFTTNASLLVPSKVDNILKYGINKIIVSFDTSNIMKLKEIRSGIQEDKVLENLAYLSKQKQAGKLPELAIETVIMRSNLHDLPYLIEFCNEFHINSIYVSHLLVYDKSMLSEILYLTISKEAWEISQELVNKGWEIFSKTMLDPNGEEVSIELLENAISDVPEIWERIREYNIEINPPLIFEASKKMDLVNETERVFKRTKEIADKYGINLELPDIFPKLSERKCPYIDRKALLIRANGEIAPCYNFLHSHKLLINNHERDVKQISFGSLQEDSLDNIVNSEGYQNFRNTLLDISNNIPWSGDCLFSTRNCFYISNNDSDCYGNHPGCNECLYSVNLVRCIF